MVQLDEKQKQRERDFDAMCVGIIRTISQFNVEMYAAYMDWVSWQTDDGSKYEYPLFAQLIGACRDDYIANKIGGILTWEP